MLKSFFSNKRNIFIFVCLLILIIVVIFYFIFIKKKTYDAFIEFSMPYDSYGEVIYTPGNNYEFNLYVDSFLNMDTYFSDGKKHQFSYVIEDDSVIALENNLLVAKKVGKTDIYIVTDDNVKSNVISLEVVENEGKDE